MLLKWNLNLLSCILINALIWCGDIIFQAVVIQKQVSVKKLLIEVISSFVFSIGIGYVFYAARCIILPLSLIHILKSRLISLDKPAEVADILTEQAAIVQKKIEALSESLNALETLREEVLRMQSVDFLICNCYLLYVTEKDGSVVSDIIHSSLLGNLRL